MRRNTKHDRNDVGINQIYLHFSTIYDFLKHLYISIYMLELIF